MAVTYEVLVNRRRSKDGSRKRHASSKRITPHVRSFFDIAEIWKGGRPLERPSQKRGPDRVMMDADGQETARYAARVRFETRNVGLVGRAGAASQTIAFIKRTTSRLL